MSSICLRNITSERSLSIDGPLELRYTQDAASPTQGGGLTILGGLGVVKNVVVGGNIGLVGGGVGLTITSTRITPTLPNPPPSAYISVHQDRLVLWSDTTVEVGSATFSTSAVSIAGPVASGALTVSGGIGVTEGLTLGEDLVVGGTARFSGPVSVLDATDAAADLDTGCLILNGGLVVRKSLRCAASIYGSFVAGDSVTCQNAVISGSLQGTQAVFSATGSSTTSLIDQ
ncbi:hypothetical protein HK102_012790, partial [Quaeritorhiza haematococci]